MQQTAIVIGMKPQEAHEQKLHEFYFSYIAYLRAAYVWFHSAHHTTRGVSFSGDHVNLYPKIYGFFSEQIDGVIEKGVAQVGMELACPKEQLAAATQIVCCYPSPASVSPTAIAATGLCMVKDIIQFVEEQFKCLEDCGALSLGLNDMLAAHANGLEDFVYLLKQRTAVEMEDGL
jgi:DNA-binding ferritin-like protein